LVDTIVHKRDKQMTELSIGNARADENEKGFGFLPVVGLPEQFWPPVVIIKGQKLSPMLTVTGGIHGCEYSSIEAAKQITEELQPKDLLGTVVVCPIVNVAAFFARRAYVNPLDEKNLNRMFPGDPEGSASQRLAYQVAQSLIQPADVYIDLHGGDIIEALVPFTIYPPGPTPGLEQESRQLAQWFGIPNIIRTSLPGSTYDYAVRLGKPAILTEAGQQGILSQEAVTSLKQGVFLVLNRLGAFTSEAADKFIANFQSEAMPNQVVFHDIDWLKSPASGIWYPAVSCGDFVQKGQTLGRVHNLFGELLTTISAQNAGRVIYLVTSLAVNAGDSLGAIAYSPEEI